MMMGFPLFMAWLWLSLAYNAGQPLIVTSWSALHDATSFALANGTPTFSSATFYLGYTAWQWALAEWLPGYRVVGPPVSSEGGRRNTYICNGALAWWITIAVASLGHVSGAFNLRWIVQNFGALMTTSILLALAGSLALWAVALCGVDGEAATGNPVYDIFMGISLHPRVGKVHLKMLYDVRIPWALLFFVSLSCALERRATIGAVGPGLWFMCIAHFLYANACHKGEEHVPFTWDITTERFGFMLFFWNAAGLPFGYSATSLYLLRAPPTFPAAGPPAAAAVYYAAVFALLLAAYWVWDVANCQKTAYKAQKLGVWEEGRLRAPPQLPGAVLSEPRTIGGRLLCDGWWAVVRKPTYTADLVMALSWGLIAGFSSVLPYWYFAFFLVVLVHRVGRNEKMCAEKYGTLWREYVEEVPYCYVPYVV